MSKKAKLGYPVIFFPVGGDREITQNGISISTELPAIISNVEDGDDDRVSLRVFNHATDGKVPLRTQVPHGDDVNQTRPYWLHLEEYQDFLDEKDSTPEEDEKDDDVAVDTGGE